MRKKIKHENKSSLSKLNDFSSEVKINIGKGIRTPKVFNNRYLADKGQHHISIPFRERIVYNLNSVLSKVIWKYF